MYGYDDILSRTCEILQEHVKEQQSGIIFTKNAEASNEDRRGNKDKDLMNK